VSRSAARRLSRILPLVVLVTLFLGMAATGASAQTPDPLLGPLLPEQLNAPALPTVPTVPDVPQPAEDDGNGVRLMLEGQSDGFSNTVTTILLLTVAATAPMLLLMMTTFTRFVIVLSLVRNGLGLQTVPPAQVLVGLAFFLTLFSMGPTLSVVNESALQPLLAGEVDVMEAAEDGYAPMRDFMLAQTREDDLEMFLNLRGADAPANATEIGPTTLIPAFIISELRTAFTIGFVVFVPFLIVDLVVAAVLMSMGMVMLPPIFVSLPLKLLLFVLVDGWSLLSRSLVGSVVGGVGAGALGG
jgi:flagellar biosynthesis protein FliP